MGAYIIRRILISIPVLFGITLIGFVALKLAPGDPLLSSVNPETLANLLSHPEILAAERHRLGFDQPIFPNQYLTWLGGVLQGDFGYSVTSHRSIADEIGARVPQTLLLMVTALTMAICIGIPIGVITAVRQYSKLDYVLNSAGDLPRLDAGLRARPRRRSTSSRSTCTCCRPGRSTRSARPIRSTRSIT